MEVGGDNDGIGYPTAGNRLSAATFFFVVAVVVVVMVAKNIFRSKTKAYYVSCEFGFNTTSASKPLKGEKLIRDDRIGRPEAHLQKLPH